MLISDFAKHITKWIIEDYPVFERKSPQEKELYLEKIVKWSNLDLPKETLDEYTPEVLQENRKIATLKFYLFKELCDQIGFKTKEYYPDSQMHFLHDLF